MTMTTTGSQNTNGTSSWTTPETSTARKANTTSLNQRCVIEPADTFIGGMGAHTERMSKMIIEKHDGPHTRFILHKDDNRLNNQRENLVCTNNNRMKFAPE